MEMRDTDADRPIADASIISNGAGQRRPIPGLSMSGLSVLITPCADESSAPDDSHAVGSPCLHVHKLPPGSPRMVCAACEERIVRSYVTAEGDDYHKYHQECFKCCDCGAGPDAGAIHEVDGKLYCDEHFGKRFAAKCAFCKKPIIPPATVINAHDSHYHEGCWKCADCHRTLTDHVFLRGTSPVCEACSKAQPTPERVTLTASRSPASGRPVVVPATDWCSGCRKRIIDGKFLKAMQREWHVACFRCTVCKEGLSGHAFHEKGGKPYCKQHFAMFAPKCPACRKPVVSGDVVKALESHWHPACFVCCQCSQLITASFSRKDHRPLCGACTNAALADPPLQPGPPPKPPSSSGKRKPGQAVTAPAPAATAAARPASAAAPAASSAGRLPGAAAPSSVRTHDHGAPPRPVAAMRPASASARPRTASATGTALRTTAAAAAGSARPSTASSSRDAVRPGKAAPRPSLRDRTVHDLQEREAKAANARGE